MTTNARKVRSRYLSSLTITLTPAGGRYWFERKFPFSRRGLCEAICSFEEGKVKHEKTLHIQRW